MSRMYYSWRFCTNRRTSESFGRKRTRKSDRNRKNSYNFCFNQTERKEFNRRYLKFKWEGDDNKKKCVIGFT